MTVTDMPPASELERRRSLPPGAEWANWSAADGWQIRTVRWAPAAGARTILFLNGRADFIEKYSETYWRWRDRGYGIVTFDWRGQGLSGRFGDAAKGCFDAWLADLDALAANTADTAGEPIVIVGHSMGAHLALRHLALASSTKRCCCAVLFAPMAGIAARGVPASLLYGLARAVAAAGSRGYAPSQGAYGERQRSPERQKLLTGDSERFTDEHWWIEHNHALALGGATWRWIAEALASCRALAGKGVPESITLPVDIFMGTGERLVDARAARIVAGRVPRSSWHDVDGGAHELLRERTDIQVRLHTAFDSILSACAA